ncbi:MAG TPA: hypothetical protein VMM35_05130 [Longimicrobiales bacterium]|nr:hypothetical protein [Longimicrobiales bacterium]
MTVRELSLRHPLAQPRMASGRMKNAAPTVLRVFVTLLAVIAAVAQVGYLDALAWHRLGLVPPMGAQMRPPFLTLMTAHAVISIVSGMLAVALVLREGPRERAARWLGLALGAWSYLTAYSGVTLLLRDPGGERMLFDAHFLAIEMAGLVGLIRFTALFPRPLTEEPLTAPPTLPPALQPAHAASVWMLRPAAPWIVGGLVLVGLWLLMWVSGAPIGDAGLHPAMDVVRFAAAGLVVLNLRRSWGRVTGEEADRLVWLMAALAVFIGTLLVFIGANVLVAVAEWPDPVLPWRPLLLDLGLLGFLVGLAAAVLYGGALDPAGTVRRIASLSTVATLGFFLAAGLEAFFSGSVLAGFALRTGVGTIIAFAIVLSTHRGLMRAIERALSVLPTPGLAQRAA